MHFFAFTTRKSTCLRSGVRSHSGWEKLSQSRQYGQFQAET